MPPLTFMRDSLPNFPNTLNMKTEIENMKPLLWNLKIVCRWSLGLVWIWEGLVPKILLTTRAQHDMVERSGLFWPDPDTWLAILGSAMVVTGIVICVGWMERAVAMIATISVMILIFLVVGNNPNSLSDLHGGIAKDACLFAVAWVVWKLGALVPTKTEAV